MKLIKKNLSLLLVMILLISTFGASFAQVELTDLNEVAWAKATVEKWAKIGLVSGYGDGTFKPGNEITRAEFATMALNAFGLESATVKGFTDVKSTDWFHGAIGQLGAMGIVNGYGDGTFKPNAPITRAEAAIILVNIQGLASNAAAAVAFEDAALIPEWAVGQIGAAYEAGYVSGYPDGTFGPGKNITRAEAVVMMDKTIYGENQFAKNWVINHAGVYGELNEKTVVEGSVYVRAEGVVLRNLEIKGDLILGKEIADGDAVLETITVAGDTEVYGGGEDSIYIRNSKLGNVRVQKENGKVRLVAVGNTSVASVQSTTVVKLEEQNIGSGDSGFGEVIIDESVQGEVVLVGSFSKITVNSPGITIVIPEGTVVEEMTVNAAVKVSGTGTVTKAVVSVDGVEFEEAPASVEATASGIKVVVGGEEKEAPVVGTTPAPAPAPSTGGGSGGGTVTPTTTTYKFMLFKTEPDKADLSVNLGEKTVVPTTVLTPTIIEGVFDANLDAITENSKLYPDFISRMLTKTKAGGGTYASSLVNRISAAASGSLTVFDGSVATMLNDNQLTESEIDTLSTMMSTESLAGLYNDLKTLYPTDTLPEGITVKVYGTAATQQDTIESIYAKLNAGKTFEGSRGEILSINVGDITLTLRLVKAN